jgi:hypothetical protein
VKVAAWSNTLTLAPLDGDVLTTAIGRQDDDGGR